MISYVELFHVLYALEILFGITRTLMISIMMKTIKHAAAISSMSLE
jgi:hypothetical protein